jgi:hypothetical protein
VTPSTNHKSQITWTRLLIDQVAPGSEWPGVENQWWYNPINQNSLRLTRVGFNWINKHTKFKLHSIKLQEKILPKQLLQLERLLHGPYFIQSLINLHVYDEQDTIMLQLHGGDLGSYLNNLQKNQ